MENNYKLQALLLLLMEYYKRRRILLHRQLISSHNALIRNLAIKRRTNWGEVCALQNSAAAEFMIESAKHVRFRTHRKERCEVFFQNLKEIGNEAKFFETFRMSKTTFELLCKKLTPVLHTDQPIFLTVPVSVDKQLAICVHKLASGCSYNELSKAFGVHRSTAHKYFHTVIEAILKFKEEYLSFPKPDEAISIAHNFKEILNLPNILGIIGDTHIPILPPDNKQTAYMNISAWPSLIMQAVVDHELLFRDIYITHGSDNDVFKSSAIYQEFCQLVPTSLIVVDNNQTLPLILIGDSSYPLHSRLLKPYSDSFNKSEKRFNSNLNTGFIVLQNAFKRLKSRWKCLSKKMEIDPDFSPSVITACAILHNFLELQKETFSDNWTQTLNEKHEFKEPTKVESNEIIIENSLDPNILRESLKDYQS